MYATINLPGSSHFQYMGPATKQECEEWIDKTVKEYLQYNLLTSTLPRNIITNKEAAKWKWLDGSKVFPDYFVDSTDPQMAYY
jgi:hypothetical protein